LVSKEVAVVAGETVLAREREDNIAQAMAEPGRTRSKAVPSPTSSQSEEELAEFKSAVLAKLALVVGKDASAATHRDWFVATAHVIRDRIIYRWLAAERASTAKGQKRVYYLSLEFLIGRLLSDVLCNLGLSDIARAALGEHLRDAASHGAGAGDGCGEVAAGNVQHGGSVIVAAGRWL